MPSASPVLPTKPSTVPARTCALFERVRRVRREVRVVELVPRAVAEPEPPAADLVPADGEDGAVRDGEDRRAERREDVVAVVPGHVRARRAERVPVGRVAVHREDVPAGRQLRLHGRDRADRRLLRLALVGCCFLGFFARVVVPARRRALRRRLAVVVGVVTTGSAVTFAAA